MNHRTRDRFRRAANNLMVAVGPVLSAAKRGQIDASYIETFKDTLAEAREVLEAVAHEREAEL